MSHDYDREIAILQATLDRLVSAVLEQQYTLNSKGWNDCPDASKTSVEARYRLQWSKAGAVRHQYDEIEQEILNAQALLDKDECKEANANNEAFRRDPHRGEPSARHETS